MTVGVGAVVTVGAGAGSLIASTSGVPLAACIAGWGWYKWLTSTTPLCAMSTVDTCDGSRLSRSRLVCAEPGWARDCEAAGGVARSAGCAVGLVVALVVAPSPAVSSLESLTPASLPLGFKNPNTLRKKPRLRRLGAGVPISSAARLAAGAAAAGAAASAAGAAVAARYLSTYACGMDITEALMLRRVATLLASSSPSAPRNTSRSCSKAAIKFGLSASLAKLV